MKISARNARIIRRGLHDGDAGMTPIYSASELYWRAYKKGRERRSAWDKKTSEKWAQADRQFWKDLSERYSNMKQIKVIFKSGADITLWVKDYWFDEDKCLRATKTEGQPEIMALDNTEIVAVLELA